MIQLRVDDLCFSYGAMPVLRNVSISDVPTGCVTATIGPNAAGKTTLFKCMSGLLRGTGRVIIDGREIREIKRQDINRMVTYLPQENPVNAVLTVFEAVLLARQHTASWRVADVDLVHVMSALADLRIEDLAKRILNELSGGQKQLVSIAQTLVREPSILLMDEPTSSLDLQKQLEVLGLVRRVSAERGITTIIALHDLNMAARFADHFIVMQRGIVYTAGSAREVLTREMVRDVYGVDALVEPASDGVISVTPIRSMRDSFQ